MLILVKVHDVICKQSIRAHSHCVGILERLRTSTCT